MSDSNTVARAALARLREMSEGVGVSVELSLAVLGASCIMAVVLYLNYTYHQKLTIGRGPPVPIMTDTERELRQDLWNMTIQRDYAERLLEESLSNEEILKEDASRKNKTIADLNSSCDTLRGQVEALTTEKRLMSQIYQDQIGMLLAKIQLKEDILKGEITDRNYKITDLSVNCDILKERIEILTQEIRQLTEKSSSPPEALLPLAADNPAISDLSNFTVPTDTLQVQIEPQSLIHLCTAAVAQTPSTSLVSHIDASLDRVDDILSLFAELETFVHVKPQPENAIPTLTQVTVGTQVEAADPPMIAMLKVQAEQETEINTLQAKFEASRFEVTTLKDHFRDVGANFRDGLAKYMETTQAAVALQKKSMLEIERLQSCLTTFEAFSQSSGSRDPETLPRHESTYCGLTSGYSPPQPWGGPQPNCYGRRKANFPPADLCPTFGGPRDRTVWVAGDGVLCPVAGDRVLCPVAGDRVLYPVAGDRVLCPVAGDGVLCPVAGDRVLCPVAGDRVLCPVAGDGVLCPVAGDRVLCPIQSNDDLRMRRTVTFGYTDTRYF